MIKKIKTYILTAMLALSFGAPALVPALNGVASADIKSNLCTGVDAAADTSNCSTATSSDSTSGLTQVAKQITKWFSIIVGAAAIIMIIYGGFRYITSGGSSDKVGSAKNTLIYAIIGLVIVALAQLIVRFVITQSDNTTTGL